VADVAVPATLTPALQAVGGLLDCPACTGIGHDARLAAAAGAMRCAQGHSFDLARQGYLSLLSGRGSRVAGDTADMVAARARFLGSGAYDPIRAAVADAAADPVVGLRTDGVVVDVGCGTGYYLAGVLDRLPDRWGVGLDVAKPAARAAARAHPRAAAVAVDTWQRLPLRTGSVAVLLDVFAPRQPGEWARVLAAGGTVVAVTPTRAHLAALVAEQHLVTVDPGKDERLAAAMSADFVPVARRPLAYRVDLTAEQVTDLVGMGPSAFHRRADTARPDRRPSARTVDVSVVVSVYRRRA